MTTLKPNDCLKTPEWVYSKLDTVDLDPCAGPDTFIGVTNYALERGEDGLVLPWHGFVYCNPPFSQKEIWAERMRLHGNGILILPERGSAPWFGPLALGAAWRGAREDDPQQLGVLEVEAFAHQREERLE